MFYWSNGTLPGKWTFIYMCIMGIDYASFYDLSICALMNCSDSVSLMNCSDSVSLMNCSDSVFFDELFRQRIFDELFRQRVS